MERRNKIEAYSHKAPHIYGDNKATHIYGDNSYGRQRVLDFNPYDAEIVLHKRSKPKSFFNLKPS